MKVTMSKKMFMAFAIIVAVALLATDRIDWKAALLIVVLPITLWHLLYVFIMKISKEVPVAKPKASFKERLDEKYYTDQALLRLPTEKKLVVAAVLKELDKAEHKYPEWPTDYIHKAAIVQEEAGELTRAALQHCYENGSAEDMKKEAVQTGAMALRFLLNMRVAILLFVASTLHAQTPCDSLVQPLAYSVGCHTYCAAGTYNINQSFCGWQRITAQYIDTTDCYFIVNGGAPTHSASIIFTPGLPGITSFTLYGWTGTGDFRCFQAISWTFTTIVCDFTYQPVGISELTPAQLQANYYSLQDIQGRPIEKRTNEILIEQVGTTRRKFIIFEQQ